MKETYSRRRGHEIAERAFSLDEVDGVGGGEGVVMEVVMLGWCFFFLSVEKAVDGAEGDGSYGKAVAGWVMPSMVSSYRARARKVAAFGGSDRRAKGWKTSGSAHGQVERASERGRALGASTRERERDSQRE
jgi:hypothetical protein